jgi:Lrp/AsnC family transcriptional regulator
VVDAIDLKILRVLQLEPDISMAALGSRVGLSHTPCWRRIKQMEADGVIRGKALLIDPAQVNLDVSVICFVKLNHHDEEALNTFETEVMRLPFVVQCYSMSGEHDYKLRVVSRDVKHYEEFVKRSLLHLPSVAFVNSSFALREVKNVTALPV